MKEDEKQPDIEQKPESKPEKKKKEEYTEFEKKMMSHGWNPDRELSAEEWIDNGFKVKQKKLDNLYEAVESLKDKLAMQEKTAYARAKADLESKRIEAIEMADVERVKEIEKQSQSLIDPSVMEHANAFKMKHSAWLNGTSYREQEMQHVCRQRDNELMIEGLSPENHFLKLENYMKGKYADYFQTEPDLAPNPVVGKQQAAIKSSSKKKITYDDLDEFQKKAAKTLQKTRGISIEDYIKRLAEIEEGKS